MNKKIAISIGLICVITAIAIGAYFFVIKDSDKSATDTHTSTEQSVRSDSNIETVTFAGREMKFDTSKRTLNTLTEYNAWCLEMRNIAQNANSDILDNLGEQGLDTVTEKEWEELYAVARKQFENITPPAELTEYHNATLQSMLLSLDILTAMADNEEEKVNELIWEGILDGSNEDVLTEEQKKAIPDCLGENEEE